MQVNISSNIKKIERSLTKIGKQQLPFATSQAINDTLFEMRTQIVKRTYPASFDVRDNRFARQSFRVEKSNKRSLEGKLFDQINRANLKLHAEGGIRRGRNGDIAIPTTFTKGKRGARGVRIPFRPKQVINSGKGFIAMGKGGEAIYQQYRKNKRRVLYNLRDSVKIKKTFPFYKDTEKVVKRVFETHFRKRFRNAIRTARV